MLQKGSLTQWIGLSDHCRCLVSASSQTSTNTKTLAWNDKRCSACGKPLKKSTGSLTNWIFKTETCHCRKVDEFVQRDLPETMAGSPAAADIEMRGSADAGIPSEPDLLPVLFKKTGDTIARQYQVVELLGTGGASVVYSARHKLQYARPLSEKSGYQNALLCARHNTSTNGLLTMFEAHTMLYKKTPNGDWKLFKKNSATEEDQDSSVQEYVKLVNAKVKKNWHPPRQHVSREVVVRFFINPNGKASKIRLVKSTPVKAANEAAIRAVRNSQPFPKLPLKLKSTGAEVEYTLKYNVWQQVSDDEADE